MSPSISLCWCRSPRRFSSCSIREGPGPEAEVQARSVLYSRKDAIDLLAKCKEEGSSMLAVGYFGSEEKHQFSCKVERVSPEELVLSGRFALVTIPLEESATFEYSETHEMRPQMLEALRKVDYCLTIHSPKVRVVLAVARPLF
jgi:hypothetical protein